MASPNFLNQPFDESEEENHDFNPPPGADSEDEKDARFNGDDEGLAKHSRSGSAPRAQPKEGLDDEGKVNGRDTSRDGRGRPMKDGADEDADGEMDGDNGEDDEDEEEEEDDDDDEEAVSVGLFEMSQN